jgi:hypothetical protein
MKQLFIGLTALGCISAAHADLRARADEYVAVYQTVQPFVTDLQTSDPSVHQLSFENTIFKVGSPGFPQYGSAGAVVEAQANYGILKALTSANFNGGSSATANVGVQFVDEFTINAPGMTGKTGHTDASFVFNWALEAQGTGRFTAYTFATLQIFFGNSFVEEFGEFVAESQQNINDPGSLSTYGRNTVGGEKVPFSFNLGMGTDFVFGQPIYVKAELVVNSSVGSGNPFAIDILSSGKSTGDVFHSVYWNGISSVNSEGSPVENFTLTSASGTDYSRSFLPSAANPGADIPEPVSIALLGIGLLALAGSRSKSAK